MKKIIKLFIVALTVVFLSGCAVLDALIPKAEMPKTPDEFRAGVSKLVASGGTNSIKKSYIIKKPYSYVVSRWKKRAHTCLKQKIKNTLYLKNYGSTSTQISYKEYTPTLKVKRKKTVLSIQMKQYGEGISMGNMITAPDGAYFMVLDAIPLKGKKTRINEYRWNLTMSNYGVVSKSIVNWASGRSKACPDYQKI